MVAYILQLEKKSVFECSRKSAVQHTTQMLTTNSDLADQFGYAALPVADYEGGGQKMQPSSIFLFADCSKPTLKII